jgi:hypothetical protein
MTDRDWGLVARENHPIPLTGVHVDGWITGLAAKVKVRQSYINREDKAIDIQVSLVRAGKCLWVQGDYWRKNP